MKRMDDVVLPPRLPAGDEPRLRDHGGQPPVGKRSWQMSTLPHGRGSTGTTTEKD